MSRALHRRLDRLERGSFNIGRWVDQALEDPAFLEEEIRLHPGRPGSREERVNAELLALGPWEPLGPIRGEA